MSDGLGTFSAEPEVSALDKPPMHLFSKLQGAVSYSRRSAVPAYLHFHRVFSYHFSRAGAVVLGGGGASGFDSGLLAVLVESGSAKEFPGSPFLCLHRFLIALHGNAR